MSVSMFHLQYLLACLHHFLHPIVLHLQFLLCFKNELHHHFHEMINLLHAHACKNHEVAYFVQLRVDVFALPLYIKHESNEGSTKMQSSLKKQNIES